MTFSIQAAEEHGIPVILFGTASVCSFLSALHIRTLIDNGVIPIKGNHLCSFFVHSVGLLCRNEELHYYCLV